MGTGIFKLAIRSILFYKKSIVNQILIIALLSAVITGSLLTGRSVKASLKKSSGDRLGNTEFLISSGIRYFEPQLLEGFKNENVKCVGVLALDSYSQSLGSQKSAANTMLYAVNSDFFSFQGNENFSLKSGGVAINSQLANYLEVNEGDEIIIRFKPVSDIPADAPFSPAQDKVSSIVMKISKILQPDDGGNFSLSISQIVPMNIFINFDDFINAAGIEKRLNRILIGHNESHSSDELYKLLKKTLKASDIGLKTRTVEKTGQSEIISDRVFIDKSILGEVENIYPSAAPLLTYLSNKFSRGTYSTPYSFVAALPESLYPEISRNDGIIINTWLAEDLSARVGDTLRMFWYAPDSLNRLIEKNAPFVVKRIVSIDGIWSDSLLMPDFPGIAGSESCSEWDAGVPVNLNEIRDKDEEYWNKYQGTPKAFINYNKGLEIWGNNYGPATSLRFESGITKEQIETRLAGAINPDVAGFSVTNISVDALSAANKSVDFSTLFLSLGFFLLLAAMVLLSFAVSSYFDTKRDQVRIFYALGFNTSRIKKLLLYEAIIIAIAGSVLGSASGYFVNIIITLALNSVWQGAVQTNTLVAYFSIIPIIIGFIITLITTALLVFFKVGRFLKKLKGTEKSYITNRKHGINLILLFIASFISIFLFIMSFIFSDYETSLSFTAGSLLLVSLILFWRQYYLKPSMLVYKSKRRVLNLSRLYYSLHPSSGITPILFIAAGVFAVFITGSNRTNFDLSHYNRQGGTGGYLLWIETAVPVTEDLNSELGEKKHGLDEKEFDKLMFTQAKRSAGNDASCLNLNHITAPPLLGIVEKDFISRGSFSFSKVIKGNKFENPWEYLALPASNNTIYGIADQTVLQWGLMMKPGDTLIMRSENGQPLNIIIAAGLKSSVFQGNVLIGMENFIKYYPSVSGSTLLLADGDPDLTDVYKSGLDDRFQNYGISTEKTNKRLAAFYEVTNTYLSVFLVFGAFGLIIGIGGLGFVLMRNYAQRKREFALLLATGFTLNKVKRLIFSEQVVILFAGITTGLISAIVATLPSIRTNSDIPWLFMGTMFFVLVLTGVIVLALSVRSVNADSLKASLKKE